MKQKFIIGMATLIACSSAFAIGPKPGEIKREESKPGSHGSTTAGPARGHSEVLTNKAIALSKNIAVEPTALAKVMESSYEIPVRMDEKNPGKMVSIKGEELADGLLKRRESISNDTRLSSTQKDALEKPVKLAIQLLAKMDQVSTGNRPGSANTPEALKEVQLSTVAFRKFVREFAKLASSKDASSTELASYAKKAEAMVEMDEKAAGRTTGGDLFDRVVGKEKREEQKDCIEG